MAESGDGRKKNGFTRGFAGAIEQARKTAPDGATEGEIQDVAFTAWMRDRKPADVWEVLAE